MTFSINICADLIVSSRNICVSVPGALQQGPARVAPWGLSHFHLSQVFVFVFVPFSHNISTGHQKPTLSLVIWRNEDVMWVKYKLIYLVGNIIARQPGPVGSSWFAMEERSFTPWFQGELFLSFLISDQLSTPTSLEKLFMFLGLVLSYKWCFNATATFQTVQLSKDDRGLFSGKSRSPVTIMETPGNAFVAGTVLCLPWILFVNRLKNAQNTMKPITMKRCKISL